MARKLLHRVALTGADEAGRGPLAGPVVCAAVRLPRGFDCTGINDSKKLTPDQREELALRIRARAVFAIEVVGVDEIDRLNILWASMEGMRRAVARIADETTRVVVDGNHIPPGMAWPCEAVIKGDGRLACIAAASILAKTARDSIMRELARAYPGYGFDRHFGYSTPEHFAALRTLGPTPIHRRTFAPVREMIDQPCLIFDE